MAKCHTIADPPAWLTRFREPHCFLCSGPTACTAAFTPSKGSIAGPPPGMERVTFIALCSTCAARADALAETVEAQIEHEMGQMAAIYVV